MDRMAETLDHLIKRARSRSSIRVAVVAADHELVLRSVHEATSYGLIEPYLIGDPDAIRSCARQADINIEQVAIVSAKDDAEAARAGVELVHSDKAEAVMKGNIHTDAFMRALLDKERGLRLLGQRVSHVFIADIPAYPKRLAITDAAINITPDLTAKAQILQNAIALLRHLGTGTPKVAALSAVEVVNPSIASTLDAACLTLMAKRGQISGAIVDGPMAFDNAISTNAAREKGIVSDVAGDVDILLVPDLVSGNILAKNLEYLAGATAAGVVLGLSAPVVLSSRADPPAARLAALALAVLMHRPMPSEQVQDRTAELESAIHCAAQAEMVYGPLET